MAMSTAKSNSISAMPLGVMSWGFELSRSGERLTRLESGFLREHGSFVLADQRFEIAKIGLVGGTFELRQDDRVIAQAKHALLGRSFTIKVETENFRLRRAWFMGRRLILEQDGRRSGSIAPIRLFTRRSFVALPPSLPDEVQVFIFWLGMVIWRRDASESF